jgi:squalene-hopene/tetraprenyl-beta-curcumene cyclase
MQNADGGWAAFDVDNNYLFMNKCPFSDLDALCDPSTADVTGRVMEAFGLLCETKYGEENIAFRKRLNIAMHLGINYLASIQESDGSWWGRWGVNYVYGTSNVLCALTYSDGGRVETMVNPALQWLKKVQRADGGWGECLATYKYPELAGTGGESTASQTAWALMGLLAHLPPTDESIKNGVAFLIESQVDFGGKGFSWIEPNFTGTGL